MLGHYSIAALASMRISGSFFWCLEGILSAIAVGTVALVGRAIGSGEKSLAAAAARGSLLFAVVVGITASVLCLLNLKEIIGFFPLTDSSVIQAADDYLRIILAALPLVLLSLVGAAIFQACGNTRTPFLISLVANAVNFVVNYILIFGNYGAPELGVRGAAIGSAIAIAINATVLLFILTRNNSLINLRGYGGEWAALMRIWRVSLPAFADRLARSFGYLGFTFMISSLGGVAMATHEAILGVEEICYMSADGFGMAAAAIVAQKLGAKQLQEATWGAVMAVALAIGLQGTVSLGFIFIPAQLLSILSPDPQIINTGIPCLYVAAVAQPFMAISIVLEQALRGAGATKIALFVSLAGWLVVRLVATYTFVFGFNLGLVGVWLGSTCDWFVRAVVLLLVFKQVKWQETIV
jgi:putative MATE family efflux protein